jgi:geranylgeranyl reductase
MNPWQQLKLTLLTLGAVLRGNALAPASYKPVESAVRSEEEAMAILAVTAIKGGIKVSSQKSTAPTAKVEVSESKPDGATTEEQRDVVGAGTLS